MRPYELFTQLHQQPHPLVIGNAWNAHSARLFEQNGYQAIGTSSAAVAYTLGYEDGEQLSFAELLFVVKHIARVIQVPFTVDMERGYGTTIDAITDNLKQLHDLGIAGVNLEDSILEKTMDSTDGFSKKINTIKNTLVQNNCDLFINARTDAFLAGITNPLAITLERIKAYTAAGADGLFVPFIKEAEDIRSVVAATNLPVNVLHMAGLPDYDTLQSLGVKRVSLGAGAFRQTYQAGASWIQQVYPHYQSTI